MTNKQKVLTRKTVDDLLKTEEYKACVGYRTYIMLKTLNVLNKLNPEEVTNDLVMKCAKSVCDESKCMFKTGIMTERSCVNGVEIPAKKEEIPMGVPNIPKNPPRTEPRITKIQVVWLSRKIVEEVIRYERMTGQKVFS